MHKPQAPFAKARHRQQNPPVTRPLHAPLGPVIQTPLSFDIGFPFPAETEPHNVTPPDIMRWGPAMREICITSYTLAKNLGMQELQITRLDLPDEARRCFDDLVAGIDIEVVRNTDYGQHRDDTKTQPC